MGTDYETVNMYDNNVPECPPKHTGLGVAALIFFTPLGIASLIVGGMVEGKYNEGNYEAAENLSRTAHKLGKIGVSIGIPLTIFIVIYYFFIIMLSLNM